MDALIMAAGRGSRLGPTPTTARSRWSTLAASRPSSCRSTCSPRAASTGAPRDRLPREEVEAAAERAGRRSAGVRARLEPVLARHERHRLGLDGARAPDRPSSTCTPTRSSSRRSSTTCWRPRGRQPAGRHPAVRARADEGAVEDGRVTHLSKELSDAETAGEFIGIGVFRARPVPAIRAGHRCGPDRGALTAYFEAALNHAIDRGSGCPPLDDRGRPWTEIDFVEDLEVARAQLPDLLP